MLQKTHPPKGLTIEEIDRQLGPQKLATFIFYWGSMYVLVAFIAIVLSTILYKEWNLRLLSESAMNHILIATNFYVYLMMTIGFILLLWKYYRYEWAKFKLNPLKNISLGVAFYFVGIFALNFVLIFLESIGVDMGTSENQEFIEQSFQLYPFYIIPTTILFAPFVEETIFRGILFQSFENIRFTERFRHSVRQRLKQSYNDEEKEERVYQVLTKIGKFSRTFLAFFVSATVFGLIHVSSELMDNFGHGLLVGLPYVVLGLSLCTVYYLTKSVYAVMITHFIQNFLSVLVSWLYMKGLITETIIGFPNLFESITNMVLKLFQLQ